MKEFISFLKTKLFFKHITLALGVLCILLLVSFKLLDVYSEHGATINTPDFKGLSINKLNDFVKEKGITYRIIDSIYDPQGKCGIVLNQDPMAKTKVKHDRVIYLYTSSLAPPTIKMPQLAGLSIRYALTMIKSCGLKEGSIRYEQGDKDFVLKQIINGKSYTAEQISMENKNKQPLMIQKGAIVNLIVGQ